MVPHLCDFLDQHLVVGRCPTRICQIAAACSIGSRLPWQAGRGGFECKESVKVTQAPDMKSPQTFFSTTHETHWDCHKWHLAVTSSIANRATAVICVDEQSYPPGESRPGPPVTLEDPPLAPAIRIGLDEAAASQHSSCQAGFL